MVDAGLNPVKVSKVVIPAAGMGTRLLLATKAQPKEMLPLVDRPAIQYVIEEAVAVGLKDMLIITGRGKRALEDYFDRGVELEQHLEKSGETKLLEEVRNVSNMADIHYIRQKETKGLGHAVYYARRYTGNEPFAVMLGDDIFQAEKLVIQQLMEVFERYRAPVIGVQEVPRESVGRYGIIKAKPVADRVYEVEGLVEKPRPEEAYSNLGVVGRYILTPDIYPCIRKVEPDHRGEIQLTDALRLRLDEGPVYACLCEGRRFDIGDRLSFLKATIELALEREELGDDLRAFLSEVLRKRPEARG